MLSERGLAEWQVLLLDLWKLSWNSCCGKENKEKMAQTNLGEFSNFESQWVSWPIHDSGHFGWNVYAIRVDISCGFQGVFPPLRKKPWKVSQHICQGFKLVISQRFTKECMQTSVEHWVQKWKKAVPLVSGSSKGKQTYLHDLAVTVNLSRCYRSLPIGTPAFDTRSVPRVEESHVRRACTESYKENASHIHHKRMKFRKLERLILHNAMLLTSWMQHTGEKTMQKYIVLQIMFTRIEYQQIPAG